MRQASQLYINFNLCCFIRLNGIKTKLIDLLRFSRSFKTDNIFFFKSIFEFSSKADLEKKLVKVLLFFEKRLKCSKKNIADPRCLVQFLKPSSSFVQFSSEVLMFHCCILYSVFPIEFIILY